MDLDKKAQWHIDFNGGAVPIMETPDGDLIKEINVIADFANEKGQHNGVDLFPRNLTISAKLRVEIERLDKFKGPIIAAQMARGEDKEKNKGVVLAIEGFSAVLAKKPG